MAVAYGSSSSTGSSDQYVTSINVPAPTGVAVGNHIYVSMEQWETANPTVTTPSGFASVGTVVSGPQKLKVFVKLADSADVALSASSGSYTFSWTGSQWTLAVAARVSGGAAVGNPTGAAFNPATAASGTAVPTTSVTVAYIPGLLHFICNENSATQTTAATGFTEFVDTNYVHGSHRMNASTSGTFSAASAVLSASTLSLSMLVAIEPAAGGSTVNGAADAPLGALAASASGVVTVSAAAAAPLGALTASATGVRLAAGTASAAFGGLTATAAAGVTVAAAAAASLGALAASANGIRDTGGTAAAPLGALAAAAAGTVTGSGSGAGSAPLGGLTASASGSVTVTAAAIAVLGALTATTSGTAGVDGVASAVFGGLLAAAAGTGPQAAAAADLGGLTASATGLRTVAAVATAVLGGLTANATGVRYTTGVAVALLGALLAAAVVESPTTRGGSTPLARTAPSAQPLQRIAPSARGGT
jgi:hypothetical protein